MWKRCLFTTEPSEFTNQNGKLLDVRRLRTLQFLRCSHPGGENVLYQAVYDNGLTVLVLVSIRGDQEVNEVKLHNELTNLANQYSAKTILALTVPDAEATEMGGYSFTLRLHCAQH